MIEPRFFDVLPSALLVTFGDRIDTSLIRRIAWFRQWIRESCNEGVLDAIPQLSGLHPWLFTNGWLSFAAPSGSLLLESPPHRQR